jgi:hypothetical protein
VKRTIFSIFARPICRSRFASPTSRSGRMLTVSVSSAASPPHTLQGMPRTYRRIWGEPTEELQGGR